MTWTEAQKALSTGKDEFQDLLADLRQSQEYALEDLVQTFADELWTATSDKNAEIERLKADLKNRFEDRKMDLQTIRIQKQLITELADALQSWHDDRSLEPTGEVKLLKRAREATKSDPHP